MSAQMDEETPSLLAVPEWTYWVTPGRFLAGCFPGSQQAQDQDARLGRLLDAGVRSFVSLMEPGELNHAGLPFADYAPAVARLAAERGVQATCHRFPIRDLNVPSTDTMEAILEHLDASLEANPLYLHCWGGVGRTGTVVACWLLRRGMADGDNVLQVLMELRKMDRMRGHRQSPETEGQRQFVASWAQRLAGR